MYLYLRFTRATHFGFKPARKISRNTLVAITMTGYKQHILIVIFFCAQYFLYSQSDTLNKRNANGHKNGYWKVYLDAKTNPTDSAKAYFYGLDLFDNGEAVYKYRAYKWKKKQKFVYEGETPIKGNPTPIKGKFIWYDKFGMSSEETYDKGHPIFIKSFVNWGSGTNVLYEDLDFTKLYNNTQGTFYFQEHTKSGDTIKYWFRKGNKGWISYPIE